MQLDFLRRLLLVVLAGAGAFGCAGEVEDEPVGSESGELSGAVLRPVDAASFQLTADDSFATYAPRLEALEKTIPKATLAEVLAGGDRNVRPLCHPTMATLGPEKGFCWQDGEDDDENVWVNQGLTGSGDASPSGVVDGRRVVLASWHSGNRHPLGSDRLARISFVDLGTMRYRHVLLVEPTSGDDFRAVASHADGLVWYGQRLLLAQGGHLRVFDLGHLWKTEPTAPADAVGRGADGRFRAAGHAFVLPQVGWLRHPGTWTCTPVEGAATCFNAIALDRADANAKDGKDSLVASEYTVRRAGGRVVRWPLDPGTGLPAVGPDGMTRATEAFTSPVWGTQGVVARNGTFAFTGVCPEHAAVTDRDMPSCLHVGRGGGSTRVRSKLPRNSQNLSYWPATNELWITNEQLRERVTFAVSSPL